MVKANETNVRTTLKKLELKNETIKLARLSEKIGDMIFIKSEETKTNSDTGEITFPILVMLRKYNNEQMHVICKNPVPEQLKEFMAIDFEKAEVVYKGVGKGQFNGNYWGCLQVSANADKPILLK